MSESAAVQYGQLDPGKRWHMLPFAGHPHWDGWARCGIHGLWQSRTTERPIEASMCKTCLRIERVVGGKP